MLTDDNQRRPQHDRGSFLSWPSARLLTREQELFQWRAANAEALSRENGENREGFGI